MYHTRIIVAKNPEEAGKSAADIFETLIATKPACVLGLATGSTPLPLYKELIAREKAGKIDFTRVRSANLDEYKGLAPTHDQSYRKFMQDNLLDHISIKPENTIVPFLLIQTAILTSVQRQSLRAPCALPCDYMNEPVPDGSATECQTARDRTSQW